MSRRLLVCGRVDTFGSENTEYFALCGTKRGNNLSESRVQLLIRTAYTLRDLMVTVFTNSLDGASTLSSRVNGADGNQSLSIPANTTGAFEDAVNSDSLSDGDLVSTQMVTGTGIILTADATRYSLEDPIGNKSLLCASCNPDNQLATDRFDPGITRFVTINGRIQSNFDTEPPIRYRFRHAATFTNLRIFVNSNGLEASTFRTRVNGVNGGQSISISATTTGSFEDTTGSDSISSGDTLNYQVIAGAVSKMGGILHITLAQMQVDSESGRVSINSGI